MSVTASVQACLPLSIITPLMRRQIIFSFQHRTGESGVEGVRDPQPRSSAPREKQADAALAHEPLGKVRL